MILALQGASAAATIVGVSVGMAALIIGLGWREKRKQETERLLEEHLRDPNPVMRGEAARAAAARGLGQSAGMLLQATRTETDPAVLQAIEAAVGSRLWEPVTRPEIVELRRWAAHLDSARESQENRRHGVVPSPDASEGGPDRPVAVLVTGAGGPAGVAVIRELRRRGHRVVALDADETAVGLDLAHDAHVVPKWDDPAFAGALTAIAAASGAEALICTVAEEYAMIDAGELEAAGVRTALPKPEAVRACLDKWAFAQAMTRAGISTPATALGNGEGVPGPWVVKPRFGRGSRDVHRARTATELKAAMRWTPDPIVQTEVAGQEFTVDALVDRHATIAGLVPRWRLETRAGISTKGCTFRNPDVEDLAALALRTVELVGPANVQGFATDDGDVVLVEINPRFSGGLPLSLHAGADLVGEYLRMILDQTVRPERLVARPGVTMRRYFEEVFTA